MRSAEQAVNAANTALRAGKIARKDCERCGAKKAEMHHPDYAKPLAVIWLCRKCHMAEHKKIRGTRQRQRGAHLSIKVVPDSRASRRAWDRAAKAAGVKPGTWARIVLDRAAAGPAEPQYGVSYPGTPIVNPTDR